MQYICLLFHRFLHSLNHKGFTGTATHTANFIYRKTIVSFRDWRFDRKWNVNTTGRVIHPKISSNRLHLLAEPYEPTPLRGLALVMREISRFDPSRFAFFDMGCGKGRVLIVASYHRFGRVVGVEFCKNLARIAQENVKRSESRRSRGSAVEVVCADAADFQFSDEDAFIFFFNPFNEEIMAKVLENIRASARNTKERYIVYYNPVLQNLFGKPDQFSLIKKHEKYFIYRMVV
ncbi:MAG: hypothetical protein JWQ23_2587 [Herminiimonas sp.]|nr:hypothetical protein [Herminiimonas sp.]